MKYECISHFPAYTAQEAAASAHIKGQELAKAVIVKLDGKMVMCVLPASHYVNFPLLKTAFGAREASLVPEEEYRKCFPIASPGPSRLSEISTAWMFLFQGRCPGPGNMLQRMLFFGADTPVIR